jgi:hypothetical protein
MNNPLVGEEIESGCIIPVRETAGETVFRATGHAMPLGLDTAAPF